MRPCRPANNSIFSNRSSPFQAADCQDEQGDAGDGRSVWPIRSLRGAGIWGFIGRDWRWAGPHQEEPPGYKEPYKWLGSGGAEWLVVIKISPGSETGMSLFLFVSWNVVVKMLSIRKSLVLQSHAGLIYREIILRNHFDDLKKCPLWESMKSSSCKPRKSQNTGYDGMKAESQGHKQIYWWVKTEKMSRPNKQGHLALWITNADHAALWNPQNLKESATCGCFHM